MTYTPTYAGHLQPVDAKIKGYVHRVLEPKSDRKPPLSHLSPLELTFGFVTISEPAGPTRRPVLLVIDVEPDARKTSAGPGGWESSEQALTELEMLRSRLEDATGSRVQLNWFLRADPQVERTWGRADWVAQACPRIIRTIEQRGDYAGIHVHLWRWDEPRKEWFNDFRDPAWTAEALRTSASAFETIFGHPPEACRFGDRWLSAHAVEIMRSAGIRYDLTVEPGMPGGAIHDDERATGTLPDYRNAPREPYVPSRANFLLPVDRIAPGDDLWIIPVSTTRPSWRLVRRSPYLMKASRSPNLALSSSYVWPHIKQQLDKPSRIPLVIVFRSGDLANARFRRNFLRTSEGLSKHPALPYCEFTNPAAAIEQWKQRPG